MSRGITINLECILSSYDNSGTTSYEYSVVWMSEGEGDFYFQRFYQSTKVERID